MHSSLSAPDCIGDIGEIPPENELEGSSGSTRGRFRHAPQEQGDVEPGWGYTRTHHYRFWSLITGPPLEAHQVADVIPLSLGGDGESDLGTYLQHLPCPSGNSRGALDLHRGDTLGTITRCKPLRRLPTVSCRLIDEQRGVMDR